MAKLFCGVDFHKRTCTIFVMDAEGRQVGTTLKVPTERLVTEIRNLRDVVVGLESSGGVNHMADLLLDAGADVRIINSNRARAIGYGGKKTDAKDAEMIAGLLRADFAPTVTLRSKGARSMSLLVTAREHLVTQRTQSICHIRGLLREYGLIIKVGVESFLKDAPRQINRLEQQDPYLAQILKIDFERVVALKKEELAINDQIEQATIADPRLKALREIPGVGLLGAYLMVAVVDDVKRFPNSKSFASYVGLVPRENSSGDARRLGSVTKAGNETLRRYLIHGGRAVLNSTNFQKDPIYLWGKRIEAKHGSNKASVALAHKLARICFALLRDGANYKSAKKKKAA